MKNLLLTVFVLSVLIVAVTNNVTHKKITVVNEEDYGCVHEDHSQYDDGDSLNLEAANFSNNN